MCSARGRKKSTRTTEESGASLLLPIDELRRCYRCGMQHRKADLLAASQHEGTWCGKRQAAGEGDTKSSKNVVIIKKLERRAGGLAAIMLLLLAREHDDAVGLLRMFVRDFTTMYDHYCYLHSAIFMKEKRHHKQAAGSCC